MESKEGTSTHSISEMVSDDSRMIPIRHLVISKLPKRTPYKDLTSYFSVYGNVECCYVCRNEKNDYAFVIFTKASDAVRAMEDTNWKHIRLHNRDLDRVMIPSDPWYQFYNTEQKFCIMKKKLNKRGKTASEHYTSLCQQNDIGKASIHILNNDCLTHIFQFLPIIDRIRIERVCKRWRYLSQGSWYTMKRLDFLTSTWGFTDKLSIKTFYKVLLKCGRYLKHIDDPDIKTNFDWIAMGKKKSLDERILTIIGKLCPNLTNIDIKNLDIYPSSIRTLAHNCRNIRKLHLKTWSCDDELKNLFKLNQNLEYLAIRRGTVNGEVLLYLPEQMHTFILDASWNIDDDFFPVALQRLKNLKHLTINDCTTDKTVKIVNTAKRTLKVIGKHCKNLTVLEFDYTFSWVETTDLLHLTHLVKLQVLKLTYSNEISDEFLANLVKRCQQLVSLDITGCYSVSNNGLNAIAALLKLEKLTISYIHGITDRGLLNMSNLKEVECRECLRFNDQGISMFIKSSLQLELLDLSGCRYITEFTLEAAKEACDIRFNNVMLKIIVGGTSIKRKILQKYVSPLLQIVNVDLSECTYFTLPQYNQ